MHPTVLPPAAKLHQQTLTADKVCTISSGCLFITYRIVKDRHLVGSGFNLCVFPRKLLPGRKELTDYTLYAANRTIIPTYRVFHDLWTLLQ